MSNIETTIITNRSNNRRSLIVYLNCGDPDIETTYVLIKLCAKQGVDLIELGVPFSNSFTDGKAVLRSHERALNNGVTFEDVIQMVHKLRTECTIPVVLLTDFSHSIKARGIEGAVKQCKESGIQGLLLHGLPPLYLKQYLEYSNTYGLTPIFSLYPNTSEEKMLATLSHSKGFVYLVSKYGRTGKPIDFCSPEITHFFASVSHATHLPLMAGFGIKSLADMNTIYTNHPIDGVIVGSVICDIIEQALPKKEKIIQGVSEYLITVNEAKNIPYPQTSTTQANNEYAS